MNDNEIGQAWWAGALAVLSDEVSVCPDEMSVLVTPGKGKSGDHVYLLPKTCVTMNLLPLSVGCLSVQQEY